MNRSIKTVFINYTCICNKYVYGLEIHTNKPLVKSHYPVTYKYRSKIRDKIQKLIYCSVIVHSDSVRNHSQLGVPKKNSDDIYVCCDVRLLNEYLPLRQSRLQKISEFLDQAQGKKYRSSFGLVSSYEQILLSKTSQPFVAFTFEGQHWQFRIIIFSYGDGSSAFNTALQMVSVNKLLSKLVRYLDDIC